MEIFLCFQAVHEMRQRGVVSAKSKDCSRKGEQWVEKDNVCTPQMGPVRAKSKGKYAIGVEALFPFGRKGVSDAIKLDQRKRYALG